MSLADLIARPDAEIDLAAAALSIAADEYPKLDVAHYLQRLAAHAEAVRQLLSDGVDDREQPGAVLEALARHLFHRESFSGNTTDYYDPRNSYLNEVLDRRTGIPITLCIVYLEVGQRVGLSIAPISFPTHFLVRVTIGRLDVVVDPFNQGAVLDNDALLEQLMPLLGDRRRAIEFLPQALASVPRREVIARMLRNLKAIHVSAGDWPRALRTIDRLLTVHPDQAEEIRDRGHAYAALEHAQAAADDYARYLRLRPDADDAQAIAARMQALRKQRTRLN